MNDLKAIFRFELKSILVKKAYKVSTIFFCIIALILGMLPFIIEKGAALFNNPGSQKENKEKNIVGIISKDERYSPEILQTLIPNGTVKEYNDVSELKNEILSGKVSSAYVIDKDHITHLLKNRSFSDINNSVIAGLNGIRRKYLYNEAGIDFNKAMELDKNTFAVSEEILGKDGVSNFAYAYFLVIAVFLMVSIYGQMAAMSVAKEKNDRTMELLITSTDTGKLINGKVMAVFLATMLQGAIFCVFFAIGFFISKSSWSNFLPKTFSLPTQVVVSFVLFFIVGFIFYLYLYAMLGALVSKVEDVAQSLGMVSTMLGLCYMASLSATYFPTQLYVKILSYIPFSSMFTMFLRCALDKVSNIEVAASLIILVISTVFVSWLSAAIYKVGTLQYGGKIPFFKALKMLKEDK